MTDFIDVEIGLWIGLDKDSDGYVTPRWVAAGEEKTKLDDLFVDWNLDQSLFPIAKHRLAFKVPIPEQMCWLDTRVALGDDHIFPDPKRKSPHLCEYSEEDPEQQVRWKREIEGGVELLSDEALDAFITVVEAEKKKRM